MKKIRKVVLGVLVIIFGMVGAVSQPAMANVTCPTGTKQAGRSVTDLALCNTENKSKSEAEAEAKTHVNNIINTVLAIVGLLAVVMIIVAGFQMTTSSGDPRKTARAKNTILYSVIGLVVAFLAYAIEHFVIGKI